MNSGTAANSEPDSALVKLADNEWFHRVWTFQELCLARRPKVVYGTTTAPWNRFCDSLEHYRSHGYSIPLSDMGSSLIWLKSSVMRDIYILWTKNKALQSAQTTSTDAPRIVLKDGPADLAMQIDDPVLKFVVALLDMSRQRLSSNPLDRIYGLHQVCADLGVSIPKPDYGLLHVDVYEEVTFSIIQRSRSLKVLECCVSKQRSDLPSWVPDFKEKPSPFSPNFDILDWRHIPGNVHLKRRKGELSLPCKILRTVEVVSDRMPSFLPPLAPRNGESWEDKMDQTRVVFQRWCDTVEGTTGDKSSRNEEGFFKTLTRPEVEISLHINRSLLLRLLPVIAAVTRSPGLLGAEPASEQGEVIESLYQRTESDPELRSAMHLVVLYIAQYLEEMVLFKTSDGLWGLSTGAIRAGDSVALFPGAEVPMIVRDAGKQESKHLLVGPASMAMVPQELWDQVYSLEGVETITLV
jgi:hypothetical protein